MGSHFNTLSTCPMNHVLGPALVKAVPRVIVAGWRRLPVQRGIQPALHRKFANRANTFQVAWLGGTQYAGDITKSGAWISTRKRMTQYWSEPEWHAHLINVVAQFDSQFTSGRSPTRHQIRERLLKCKSVLVDDGSVEKPVLCG